MEDYLVMTASGTIVHFKAKSQAQAQARVKEINRTDKKFPRIPLQQMPWPKWVRSAAVLEIPPTWSGPFKLGMLN